MLTYITIELFLIPFKLIKFFTVLSIEVVKFMLLLPTCILGGIRKWTKKLMKNKKDYIKVLNFTL